MAQEKPPGGGGELVSSSAAPVLTLASLCYFLHLCVIFDSRFCLVQPMRGGFVNISAVAVWDTPETRQNGRGGTIFSCRDTTKQDSPNPTMYYLRVDRLNSRVEIYEANRTLA